MKQTKKVALITIYGECNFGNRLQNYAACHALSRLGYTPVTLAVLPPKAPRERLKLAVKYAAGNLLGNMIAEGHPRLVSEARFRRFTKKHIPTRYITAADGRMPDAIANEYDLFFTGSDQVFNPCFGGYDTMLDTMLLTFLPSEKKRCFSPSFGVSELPAKWQPRFKEALLDFPSLNVREAAGADIIRSLTGREATVTLDPTLLLDAAEWRRLSRRVRGVPQHFALDYFLGTPPTGEQSYTALGGDLPRVKLQDEGDRRRLSLGPAEFLDLFSRADTIFTDSFHATVFAILFGKPFVLYARQDEYRSMLSRLETLLSLFGKTPEDCMGKLTVIDPALRDRVLSQKREELLHLLAPHP